MNQNEQAARYAPRWPCVLRLDGDDELLFLASASALEDELEGLILCDEDCLIDSDGRCFQLEPLAVPRAAGQIGYRLVLQPILLDAAAMSLLLQAHEFARAQTCLIKIQFPSVALAIAALDPHYKR